MILDTNYLYDLESIVWSSFSQLSHSRMGLSQSNYILLENAQWGVKYQICMILNFRADHKLQNTKMEEGFFLQKFFTTKGFISTQQIQWYMVQ
jgi:hypothetical protein